MVAIPDTQDLPRSLHGHLQARHQSQPRQSLVVLVTVSSNQIAGFDISESLADCTA